MGASGTIYALYLKFLTQRNLVAEIHRKNVGFTCEKRISVSEPPFFLRGAGFKVTYAIHL